MPRRKKLEDISEIEEKAQKRGSARYAVIYIHHQCPICASIFRISLTGLIPRTIPVFFVNAENTSAEERLAVWGFTLGPYGLSMRITVPMLAVWEIDASGNKRLIYKREIRPLRGPILGQEEIKEVFFEIRGFLKP